MEKNKGFGVAPLKNEGMWTNGVETFEKKPEGYEVVTYKTGWAIDEHGNDITDTPEGQAHLEQMNKALRKAMQPTHSETESLMDDELDDPYLELFDRINQMELDQKEMSYDIVELRALVMSLRTLYDAAIAASKPLSEQQRAYDLWVARGMPVGGSGYDGVYYGLGIKDILGDFNNKPTLNPDQQEFKFFD